MEDVNWQNLTTARLKEMLRERSLSTSGTKNELVARLLEHGGEMDGVFDGAGGGDKETGPTLRDSAQAPELELLRLRLKLVEKEKEMAIREAELAKRELELLRLAPASDELRSTRTEVAAATSEPLRMSITAIAELLSYFDGSEGTFETWTRQFRHLSNVYGLRDDACRILIVSRLRGKALDWFHSRPEYTVMAIETFLEHMSSMFHQRPNRLLARRRFEERTWQRGETFADYLHQKVILANRIPIDGEELIDCIVDGIPDPVLQDQARLQRFRTNADLLEAFGKISLRQKTASATPKGGDPMSRTKGDGPASPATATRRCSNCGDRGHPTSKCPTQNRGRKCFQCNDYGHISRDCPTKKQAPKNVLAVAESAETKFRKDVRVNGCAAVAVLDTGSDVSLIRKSAYFDVGAPPLTNEIIHLRGIGSQEYRTLGKFDAEIMIDDEIREATLHVVENTVLNHGVLLGYDFINAAEWTVRDGTMTLAKRPNTQTIVPEVLYVGHEQERDAIDLSHVKDAKLRKEIETVVREYKPDKSRDVGVTMKIIVKDDEPVYQRPRRLSPSERETVNRQINEWICDGIVQPSLSEYASPVVLVKKKDGTPRLCVDFRQLNAKIVRDRYPLPLIEDQLDFLRDATIYSTLDLRNAFFHVTVEPESRKYTSFVVPDGQYEFLKVPFGLCNSPAVFQRFVNVAFKDLIAERVVLTYIDDLVVPATDYESAKQRLISVLKRASECGLIINWSKCELLKTRVEYLGHVVEGGTVRPSENKAKAVARFPAPTTIKQLQSFLGLAGYFRKFIPEYSTLARPLTRLLKADVPFRFGSEEQNAFQSLKEALLKKPVLRIYWPERETELHTDASIHGYGAILLQRDSEDGH
ncbi:uncharacterized protein LOC143187440 [Calliopsis andreniformis]|uniref:uncharacterized protein LOC143187440 n=1 Tax=Calliopsis andreniformis TaxID=337506 RepID=UPI003FCD128A